MSNNETSSPPFRGLAMILAAVALLLAGWGFYTSRHQDEADSAATAALPQAVASASAPSAASETTSAAVIIPVHALNNSNVAGLAQKVADDVRGRGWTIGEIGNYPYEILPASVVFYTAGNATEERAAKALAEQLAIIAEPRPEKLHNIPAGIVLVITEDLNR